MWSERNYVGLRRGRKIAKTGTNSDDDRYSPTAKIANFRPKKEGYCGFYSDKKQGVVAAFFLSQIYRPWGLTAHRRWARLMLDRRCLVEVPNAPSHRAERAHADADYDEETAFDNYFSPEAGHRAEPEGPTNA